MKKHLGNLGLLIALLALLVAPLAGFKFVSYDQDTPQVLSGVSTREARREDEFKTDKEEKEEEEKEHVFMHPSNVIRFFR